MAEETKPLDPLFPGANKGSTEHAVDERFEELNQKIGSSSNGGSVPLFPKPEEGSLEDSLPDKGLSRNRLFIDGIRGVLSSLFNDDGFQGSIKEIVGMYMRAIPESDIDSIKSQLGITKQS